MAIAWGYSPKIEKYIPLGDFPADKYIIIAKQAAENLGWNISHISDVGVIAYTPLSLQSYSEEISIKIEHNFAIVKSECIGIQLLFNDYGKNEINLDKFFHEFKYVEFHLEDVWQSTLENFHAFANQQDKDYFEKAPLTAKNKIKNVLYLLLPQKNYQITPILILINIALYFLKIIASIVYFSYVFKHKLAINEIENLYYYLGGNSREVVLNGQYWRLLTYQFIHGSFSHLFFNMYALAYIGLMIEHKLGTKKYLTIYFLSGISGGVLSMFFHTDGYMVGASGAIIGMFGAFLALLLGKAFEKNATKALLISTIAVTLIMLLNGLKGGVDNAAHVGGLLAGFLITTILFHQKPLNIKLQEKQRYLIAVLLAIVFAIPSLLLMPKYQIMEFNRLEIEYQLNARKFTTIYWLKRGLSKEEKLSAIKINGINVWKANDSIVKKMDLLKVAKRQQNIISFHQKMVKRHLELVGLFYKRTTTNGQTYFYDTEIQSLQMDINNIRLNIKNPTRF